MSLLEVEDLHAFYGKSHALHGVSFGVAAGRITTLLGRNGAGKTTTLRAIMGLVPPRRGSIRLGGEELAGEPPHRVFRRGVGYVPEGRQIFPHLAVGENLRLGTQPGGEAGHWTIERALEAFPALRERVHQKGRSLSGGEQQMLAIARALVGNPRLLVLDEPTQGLAPLLVRDLARLLGRLRNDGLTILLVEQNVRVALGVADDVLVLAKGRVVFSGPADEFRRREDEMKGRFLSV